MVRTSFSVLDSLARLYAPLGGLRCAPAVGLHRQRRLQTCFTAHEPDGLFGRNSHPFQLSKASPLTRLFSRTSPFPPLPLLLRPPLLPPPSPPHHSRRAVSGVFG